MPCGEPAPSAAMPLCRAAPTEVAAHALFRDGRPQPSRRLFGFFFFILFFLRGHHRDSKASAWRPDAGHLAWRNEVKGDAQPPQPGSAPAQGCCACPEPLSCKLSSSCLHTQQNGFIYVAFQAGSTAGRGTRDRGSERSCPKI